MSIQVKKILRTISKLILIFVGVGLFLYFGYVTYESFTVRPFKVRVTNTTESSFTVSWTTNSPMKGIVYYKEKDSFLVGPLSWLGSMRAYDDRDYAIAQTECVEEFNQNVDVGKDFSVSGESFNCEEVSVSKFGKYYTHHVTLKGLDSEKEYFFRVGDGYFSWDVDSGRQVFRDDEFPTVSSFSGKTFSVKESVSEPNPAFGEMVGVVREGDVFKEDDSVDGLVFAKLVSLDNLTESSILSSSINSTGGWYIDKGNARQVDGSLYDYVIDDDYLYVGYQYMDYEASEVMMLRLGFEDAPAPNMVGVTEEELRSVPEQSLWERVKSILVKESSAECNSGGCSTYVELMQLKASSGDRQAQKEVNKIVSNYGGSIEAAKKSAVEAVAKCGASCNDPKIKGYGNWLKDAVADAGNDEKKLAQVAAQAKAYGFSSTDSRLGSAADYWSSDTSDLSSGGGGSFSSSQTVQFTKSSSNGADTYYLSIGGQSFNAKIYLDDKNYQKYVEECKVDCSSIYVQASEVKILELLSNAGNSTDAFKNSIRNDSGFQDMIEKYIDENKNSNSQIGKVLTYYYPQNENAKLTDWERKNSYQNSNTSLSLDGYTYTGDKKTDFVENLFKYGTEEEKKAFVTDLCGPLCTYEGIENGKVKFKDGGNLNSFLDISDKELSVKGETFQKIYREMSKFPSVKDSGITVSLDNISNTDKYINVEALKIDKNNLKDLLDNDTFKSLIIDSQLAFVQGIEILEMAISPYAILGGSSGSDSKEQLIVKYSYIDGNNSRQENALSIDSKEIEQIKGEDIFKVIKSGKDVSNVSALLNSAGLETDYNVKDRSHLYIIPSEEYLENRIEDTNAATSTLQKYSSDSASTSLNLLQKYLLPKKAYAQDSGTSEEGYVFMLPEYGLFSLQLGNFEFAKESSNGETVYLFYIEANGIDGFQPPEDPDNRKYTEDIVLKSSAYRITYEKKAEIKEYNIKKGINMISFDLMPMSEDMETLKARDIIKESEKIGTQIKYITYFEGGRWLSGYSCLDSSCMGDNFTIVPGRGYLVYALENGVLRVPGYKLTSSIPVPFSSGWNFVGIHGYSKAYTAKSLIQSINNITGLTADNVTWWPTSKGKYEGIQITNGKEYGFDFPITTSNGYFVRITNFKPESSDCKSIIWHEGGDLDGKCGHSRSIF